MYSRGLTLIEALVSVAVFTLAMMALIVSLLSFYRANTYTLEQAQAVSDARRAIEGAIRQVREATYSSEGGYPIVSFATSSLTFYADIDQDTAIERVRYFADGTNFKRAVLDPSGNPPTYTGAETISTLTTVMRNLEQDTDVFTYYDEGGAEITDFSDVGAVRFVSINAIINVSPDRLPNELTLHSSANIRNLTDNL